MKILSRVLQRAELLITLTQTTREFVRYDFLKAVIMRNAVSWEVTQCTRKKVTECSEKHSTLFSEPLVNFYWSDRTHIRKTALFE